MELDHVICSVTQSMHDTDTSHAKQMDIICDIHGSGGTTLYHNNCNALVDGGGGIVLVSRLS